MHFTAFHLVSAALLLAASAAQAETSEEDDLARSYGDKNFVSIATGARQPLARAPAVASVITAEDIAAMGATDLNQVLESVPGLHVERYISEYAPIYVVRGIFNPVNSQVLMLKNGIPITSLVGGGKGADQGDFPLENIARIEVIRGPGSALYGSDAYSAVINLVTKSAAELNGTLFGVRSGSFQTQDAWLQHGGKFGGFEVGTYLRIGSTQGSKSIIDSDAQSLRDRLFGTHASLAPGPLALGYDAIDANLDVLHDKWRLRAAYALRDNVGTGAGLASSLDPAGQLQHARMSVDLSWADPQFAPGWGGGALLSYLGYKQRVTDDIELSPPGTRLPSGLFPNGQLGHSDTAERQIRVAAHLVYSGFEQHKLRLGAGHEDLNMYATATLKNYIFNAAGVPVPAGPMADYSVIQPFLLPHRRKLDYLYLQDEWQLGKDVTLTGGLRHDRYSDFGNTTNPRLALVWKMHYEVSAKLLYGSAFRAPSFNEAYGINNPVARGNPSLRPETMHTLEAVLSWQMRPDTQWNLNIFQYRMQDIISAVPNAAQGSGAIYANTGNQQGRGLEIELASDAVRDWHLNANYAYQHSINQSTQQDAGYAPRHHVYAGAAWRFQPGWQVGAQFNYIAGRQRAAGDARAAIADYSTTDLTLQCRPGNSGWSFSVSVRNLFNADVREPTIAPGLIPNDLPMPRRNGYVQASYAF